MQGEINLIASDFKIFSFNFPAEITIVGQLLLFDCVFSVHTISSTIIASCMCYCKSPTLNAACGSESTNSETQREKGIKILYLDMCINSPSNMEK